MAAKNSNPDAQATKVSSIYSALSGGKDSKTPNKVTKIYNDLQGGNGSKGAGKGGRGSSMSADSMALPKNTGKGYGSK
jgi:hypothetical protein